MTSEPTPRCFKCGAQTDRWSRVPRFLGDDDGYRHACTEHRDELVGHYRRNELRELYAQIPHARNWTLASYPLDHPARVAAHEIVLDWLDGPFGNCDGSGLWLTGTVGSGKTGLALAILRHDIEHDDGACYPRRYVNLARILPAMRRSFAAGEPDDPAEDLASASLLVLDDLGVERLSSEWAREWLSSLIEERYVNERSTIVTSNYAPSEIAARFGRDDPAVGARLVSRLMDRATGITIRAPDLRAAPPILPAVTA